MIEKDSSLANLVAKFPSSSPVLEEWTIDYSAGGEAETLEEACIRSGVCLDEVIVALSRAHTSPGSSRDLSVLSRAELVAYVREQHHAYLRKQLPRLKAAVTEVARIYGAALREIGYVERILDRLFQDLERHLWKEEFFAFPWLSEESLPDAWVVDSLAEDRKLACFRLDCLRFVTQGYRIPDQVGPSYHRLYNYLRLFEKDVRLQVYVKDHFLFAKAA